MTSSSDTGRMLREAEAALRAGYLSQAHMLLRRVVDADPENEQAWLLISDIEDTNIGKLHALDQVLRINPANEHARSTADQLRKNPTQRPAPVQRPRAPHPAPPPVAAAAPKQTIAANAAGSDGQPSSAIDDLKPMLAARPTKRGPFRMSEWLILLIALVVILVGGNILMSVMFPEQPFEEVALAEPGEDTTTIDEQLNQVLQSSTYTLGLLRIEAANEKVTLSISITNPTGSPVQFRAGEITVTNGSGEQLEFNAGQSTIADVTLQPDEKLYPLLVYEGELSRPITIRWSISGETVVIEE